MVVFIVWLMSLLYRILSLTVRSVRLGVSQLSWTDASLSGTSWRPWCSCCRYTLYNTDPDDDIHDCATLSGRWCYCCRFRMWFQPRCHWSVWSNQMSSGIRRWRTSASGRRRTAWASRWVSRLQLARVQLQVSFILTYAFTELHRLCWEGPEMILELQKLLWIWDICPLLENDFFRTWRSQRSVQSKAIFQENSGNFECITLWGFSSSLTNCESADMCHWYVVNQLWL